jgi:uncharacterized protein YxeA
MICPKCRHENQDDTAICEFCGEALKVKQPPKKFDSKDDDGFSIENLKLIFIGIIILFIVTVALLWPNIQVNINSTDSFLSTQASWNQIAVYNGTSDDVMSFQIKGKKMKVYLTAQPLSPETSLKCQIYGSSGATSGDDLTWKGGDISPKTMSLQHQTIPGNYMVNIDIPDFPANQVQWTVQVFDYY